MEPYKKVVYIWHEPQPLTSVPNRLHFHAAMKDTTQILIKAVSQVMAHSKDRSDQKAVALHGAQNAANRFISQAGDYFHYELSWWQLAYNQQNELVGFVLPVTFPNCQKDGLEEATIYYVGVLPQHRGHGYAYDLLCQCTHIMQKVGIWRIYCDTDVHNTPMIETFKRAGYQQEGEPKIIE